MGGSAGGTGGEGEDREEEESMEEEERRGEEDAWLVGLPPPRFDLLLWKDNYFREMFI